MATIPDNPDPERFYLVERLPSRPPRKAITAVYFILAEKAERIKIGCARDPYLRLEQLQTGCPEDLLMMGIIAHPSAQIFEKQLHEQFAHLRARGEWFLCESDLVEYVAAHRDPPVDDPYPELEPYVEAVAEPRRPQFPAGVDIPLGTSRKAILARYKLARGLA